MRRAQAEAIGIAIIVVLFILAAVVFLSNGDRGIDPRAQSDAILRENFLYMLLNTDVVYGSPGSECSTRFLQAILRYNSADFVCAAVTSPVQITVNEHINSILRNTLDRWGKTYSLRILDRDGNAFLDNHGVYVAGCDGATTSSGIARYQDISGYTYELEIC